jgi:hypothetical protein
MAQDLLMARATYKIKRHKWERGMDRPPSSSMVLREVVLSKISYFQPKNTAEILQDVIDDYGPLDERSLYRYLKYLKDNGKIKSLISDTEIPSYLRTGHWIDREKPSVSQEKTVTF